MTTLYRKRGKRYLPVAEEDQWGNGRWPEGFHLVYCKPGSLATRFRISPATAEMRAAAMEREDELRSILLNAMAARPRNRPVTRKEKEAWEAFVDAMGKNVYLLEYPSVQEVIDMFIAALLK